MRRALVCLLFLAFGCQGPGRRAAQVQVLATEDGVLLLAEDGTVNNDFIGAPQALFAEVAGSEVRRAAFDHDLGGIGATFPEPRLHREGSGALVALAGSNAGVALGRQVGSAFPAHEVRRLGVSFCESWVGDDGLLRLIAGTGLYVLREDSLRAEAEVTGMICGLRSESRFVATGDESGFFIVPGRGGAGQICAGDECAPEGRLERFSCADGLCGVEELGPFPDFGYDGSEPSRERISAFLLGDGSPCVVALRHPFGEGETYRPVVLTPSVELDLSTDGVFSVGGGATPDGLLAAMLTYDDRLVVQRFRGDGEALNADDPLDLGHVSGLNDHAGPAVASNDEAAFVAFVLEGVTVRLIRLPHDGSSPETRDIDLDPARD